MPYPLASLPDDELALIQYLRSISAVTALVPGVRITTELPPSPTYPVVLVQRAGGTVIARAIDDSALQVDVINDAGKRRECKILAQTVRAAVLAIANDQVAEAVLASGFEEIGPQYIPDTIPVPPLPRYTARYRVLLHA
jgi:hypothetical protein